MHPSLIAAIIRPRFLLLALLVLIVGLLSLRCQPQDRYAQRMASAHRAFSDGDYRLARADFAAARIERADDREARFGEALALLQLGDHAGAERLFDALVADPDADGAAYVLANRGILRDRAGRHEEALLDYEMALRLDPTLADGPGFMTRFLRNQVEHPPTIADRARYLRAELAKPPTERLLAVPAADARQRPYSP